MIKTVRLNELDLNTFTGDNTYYFICDNNPPVLEIIYALKSNKLKRIPVYGKKQMLWEEYSVLAYGDENSNFIYTFLDDFIWDIYVSSRMNEETVIVYDDETIMDFVMKSVHKLYELNVSIVTGKNEIDGIKYDESDFLKRVQKIEFKFERAELNHHTSFDSNEKDADPFVLLFSVALAVTDYKSTESFKSFDYEKTHRYEKYRKYIFGVENDLNDGLTVVLSRNRKGINLIKRIGDDEFLNKCRDNGKDIYEIIENNRSNVIIGLPVINEKLINFSLNSEIEELINLIKKYDYVEVAPLDTYKYFIDDLSEDDIRTIIRNIISASKQTNTLCIASKFASSSGNDLFLYHQETFEMINEFNWLNDYDLAFDIVSTNTRLIADKCDEYVPYVL